MGDAVGLGMPNRDRELGSGQGMSKTSFIRVFLEEMYWWALD